MTYFKVSYYPRNFLGSDKSHKMSVSLARHRAEIPILSNKPEC